MDANRGGFAPGMTLGTYRLERLLGRGGMGTVFLAYDTRLHREVALKVVDSEPGSATSNARLLREARNAAALNHPHICAIHEVGESGGRGFIAMEYVEGRSLRDRVDEGALPIGEAVRLGIEAADALGHAHDHGVVHRDFKAANAIVGKGGWLKVVDFGLARRDDPSVTEGTTMASVVPVGAVAGTPYAMAPEQVRGEAADAPADVWALGVLLYEMVSGVKPFSGQTVPELYSAILTKPPVPLPSTVPTGLCAVIERCLQKDPLSRYSRAGEVRAALEAIEAGTVAPWVTWGYSARRRPILVSTGALAALVVTLVGLNVGGVRDRLGGVPAPAAPIKLAVLPFQNLTGDPDQEYFSDGLTDEMITQLGRLQPRRLSVIARTSSMRYKGRDVPIDQIGRELGVDYVLEGSARREGNLVRISATLIRAHDQTQRWTDSFERELSGILAVQSGVARGVAGSLALTLLPSEQARLDRNKPVNPGAYEAYLMGLSHAVKMTRPDLDAAEKYFNLALGGDPEYARAYAGLSKVWSLRRQMQFVAPKEATAGVKAAGEKALALDPTLPEAHERLAIEYANDWNWGAANSEYQRVIELGPDLAEARASYSHLLYKMKRPAEARAQMQLALELDPLNEGVRAFYAVTLAFEHRTTDEEAELRNVLKTNPNSPMATTSLSRLLHRLGRYEDSLAAERGRLAARGDTDIEAALLQGYDQGGYREAMRQAADAMAAKSRATGVQSVDVATLYMRAGARTQAIEWLENAFDTRDPNISYIGVAPIWDDLHGDSRFQNLLRRMNLPM
jgi:TolB-like protein/Tfp pilus assembly protein PilF/predicted Ser/Thr protein kinase